MRRRPIAIRAGLMLAGAACIMTAALAQQAPESLLPPGFDQPRPNAAPSPRPSAAPSPRSAVRPGPAAAAPAPRPLAPPPAVPRMAASPVVQPLPAIAASGLPESATVTPTPSPAMVPIAEGGAIPSLAVLETLSPGQIDTLLGLDARVDTPPGARRDPAGAGLLDESEGGLPLLSLANQDASLVRAILAGNDGLLVSRWGHILLRRALLSRLAPPRGMDPADFAALRVALLVRMGEGAAARALAQDVDTDAYTPALAGAAFDAYVATADLTGACPVLAAQAAARNDPPWQVAGTICAGFRGDARGALQALDQDQRRALLPRIDMLLAEKYLGAAGGGRRAVTIDWNDVDDMTPWRYGLSLAVGIQPPATLTGDASPRYAYAAAIAPMLGLGVRADAADQAGAAGILSSAAMVDLYSQIFADQGVTGDVQARAAKLRDAYAAADAADRLAAIQAVWNGAEAGEGGAVRYARLVLTGYAAARLPVARAFADQGGDLVASMLSAGLDANAIRWRPLAPVGSQAWALLALAAPDGGAVGSGDVTAFARQDRSGGQRKAAFLIAGLAGLGRLPLDSADAAAGTLGTTLGGSTRWTRAIDQAAGVGNAELVALLTGLGMQGAGWDRMTPRFLYHMVAALKAVGLEAEARMIAAEAVARG